ncbi:MAG: helix-turn-helix domain-containing protein [Flavobacteriales bacterium]
MPRKEIPVHYLDGSDVRRIRVERILPSGSEVRNEVHRHDFHELFFLTEGNGDHMVDLTSHRFSAPCMHAIAAGQVHRLGRSACSSGTVLLFQREAIHGTAMDDDLHMLFGGTNSRPVWDLHPAQFAFANKLLDLIADEATSDDPAAHRAANGLLAVLIAKCAQWTGTALPRRTDHEPSIITRRFLGDVERDFLTERRVAAYADRYAITADHLSDLLRDSIGRSAMTVLQDRLILEAKRLLLHSAMSVKEVGYALNLEDPAYFSRMFKKATGHTPMGYRDHIREVYKG